jgi:hypothetical protein
MSQSESTASAQTASVRADPTEMPTSSIRTLLRKQKEKRFDEMLNNLVHVFSIRTVHEDQDAIENPSPKWIDDMLDTIDLGVPTFEAKSSDMSSFGDLSTHVIVTKQYDSGILILKKISEVIAMNKQVYVDLVALINKCPLDDNMPQTIDSCRGFDTLSYGEVAFQLVLFSKYMTKKHLIAIQLMLAACERNDCTPVIKVIENLQTMALEFEGLLDYSKTSGLTSAIMSMYERKYIDICQDYLKFDVISYPDLLPIDCNKIEEAHLVSHERMFRAVTVIDLGIPMTTHHHHDWEGLDDIIIAVRTRKTAAMRDGVANTRRFCRLTDLTDRIRNRHYLEQTIEHINQEEYIDDGILAEVVHHNTSVHPEYEFAFELNRKQLRGLRMLALVIVHIWEELYDHDDRNDFVIKTLNRYAVAYEELLV